MTARKLVIVTGFILLGGCAGVVRSEVADYRAIEPGAEMANLSDELQNLAAVADGLVRVQLKFPRQIRDSNIGGTSGWRENVELSYCKRDPNDREDPGMPASWETTLQAVAPGPLTNVDTWEIYLPRNLGALVNGPGSRVEVTWPDKAVRENELCLEIWSAFYWWKRFEIEPIELGEKTGFLATGP
jgi:hypothetical protein